MDALGAAVLPMGGSRFAIALNGAKIVIHRPHPRPELYVSIVQRVRRFLDQAGVRQ